jgi:hypothetical protein
MARQSNAAARVGARRREALESGVTRCKQEVYGGGGGGGGWGPLLLAGSGAGRGHGTGGCEAAVRWRGDTQGSLTDGGVTQRARQGCQLLL